ncbi:MAG: hypothetical protein EXS16_05990 [Gemmataceae bacterium]|nr:hypothetical protein [Gemmataceae bacterium]
MARPELCVIFNPTAGKHRGRQRLEQIRQTWGAEVAFRPTTHPGHAVELAESAAREGIPVVAAAGGDGTAHEVLNGLMSVRNPDVAFSIIPIGSANDYAFSLGLDPKNPPAPRHVDVGCVNLPDGKRVYFGCCLGTGFNGRVTWESRKIRRLQGVFLYGLAAIRSLVYHYEYPPVSVRIDDEPAQTVPTLMFSALLGKREGGFTLAPHALIDDGWFDYVHAADLTRWQILQFLPRLALFGPPASYPKLRQGKCRRIVLQSEKPIIAHADGELFCLPENNVRELEIVIEPAALHVVALQKQIPE